MAQIFRRAYSTFATQQPNTASLTATVTPENMAQLPSKQKAALATARRSHALAPVPASVQNARPSGEDKHHAGPKTPEKKKEQKDRKKNLPDTPPPVITDSRRGMDYRREKSLGEGGFARCFEVYNPDNEVFAAKVVSKKSLNSARMKSKFLGELQVHKTMEHPNIVRFKECFEDSQNVYMILELCSNKSLMDLLRRRKFFSEPEARFFLIQMLGAVKYMHSRNVIHRDLKLGNIFLDENLNVKIGDFGLAALLIDGTERKNTICGTPNYIAPEVLFGKEEGHSFEVDLWSLGIILYAMLVGKPPFQSGDVKEIYQKIKVATFSYPPNPPQQISSDAKDLIKSLLSPDPRNRPTIDDIADHPFFKTGFFPRSLPITTLKVVPVWEDLVASNKRAWHNNFLEVARKSGVGLGIEGVGAERGKGVQILPINEDDDEPMNNVVVQAPIGQKMIVAPVVLLSPASQRTKPNQRMIPEELSPKITKTRNINAMPKIPSRLNPLRELQQQRASKESLTLAPLEGFRDLKISSDKTENTTASSGSSGYKLPTKLGQRGTILDSKIRAPKLPTVYAAGNSRSNPIDLESATTASQPAQRRPSTESIGTTSSYRSNVISNVTREIVLDNVKQTLKSVSAFNKRTVDTLPPQPKETRIAIDQTNRARVTPMDVESGSWITKWVDYSNKYGVGYIMNDDTTGCIFRDGTNILLDFPKPNVEMDLAQMEYIHPKKASRTTMPLKDAARFRSSGLADKAGVCKKLGEFMLSKLGANNLSSDTNTGSDGSRNRPADFSERSYISHFIRISGGIGPDGKEIIYAVFRLDEGGFQINFPDHFKIVLHHDGRTIRFFDQAKIVYTVSLEELYTLSHSKRQTGVAVFLAKNNIHEKMQIFQSVLEGWLSCDAKTGEFLRKGQRLALGEIVIALGGYASPDASL